MAPFSPIPPRHPIRVVLSSTALQPFMSVRKAAALAIAQLGIAAFFISGIARSALGESAVWFVLAASIVATFVRAIDIESWALLIPGGFVSRVTSAFGPRTTGLARAAALAERVLLGALACVVAAHYVATVPATAIAGWRFRGFVRPEDLATMIAAGVIGSLWLRARLGRDIEPRRDDAGHLDCRRYPRAHHGLGRHHPRSRQRLHSRLVVAPSAVPRSRAGRLSTPRWRCLLGFALTVPAVGGGEALARAAHEFPPPRVHALRRTAFSRWCSVSP